MGQRSTNYSPWAKQIHSDIPLHDPQTKHAVVVVLHFYDLKTDKQKGICVGECI